MDETARAVFERPFRSALSATATALGVAVLVAITGLAATGSVQVSRRFDAYEASWLTLREQTSDGMEDLPAFNQAGLDRLRRTTGVIQAAESWALGDELPTRTMRETDPTGLSESLSLVAAGPEIFDATDARVDFGRVYDRFHEREAQPVAVLGGAAARQLKIDDLSRPRAIIVGGSLLTVIGVLADAPGRPDLMTKIIVPFGAGERFLGALPAGTDPPYHEVIVKVSVGSADVIGAAAPVIVNPAAPDRVFADVPPSPELIRQGVEGDIQIAFLGLAVVALIVGILGIANATLVSVMQRTREFGVRRALGARGRHVALHVLSEAAVLGLLGGFAGLCLGLLSVVALAAAQGWIAAFNVPVTIAAPFIGVLAGSAAGCYPAWRASAIEPVEALRQ